jgi:hypothetical protein
LSLTADERRQVPADVAGPKPNPVEPLPHGFSMPHPFFLDSCPIFGKIET